MRVIARVCNTGAWHPKHPNVAMNKRLLALYICAAAFYLFFHDCPRGTVLTVRHGGNTSNNIWEYLSVYAVSGLHRKFVPFVPDETKRAVEEVFEGASIRVLSELPPRCLNYAHATYVHLTDPPSVLTDLDPDVRLVVLEKYSARYEEVLQYGIADIRKTLRFKDEDVKAADEFLRRAARNGTRVPPIYVGMHYRGGDYVDVLRENYRNFRNPPTYRYYAKAMDYFKRRYPKAIFVLATTDAAWLAANLEHLPGVHLSPFGDAKATDMALLALCNHTIINYGTYGATAALWNGGTTVAYDLGVSLDHRGMTVAMGVARRLDDWFLMS